MQQSKHAAEEDVAGEAVVEVQDHHSDPELQDRFDREDPIADELRNAEPVSSHIFIARQLLQEVGGI